MNNKYKQRGINGAGTEKKIEKSEKRNIRSDKYIIITFETRTLLYLNLCALDCFGERHQRDGMNESAGGDRDAKDRKVEKNENRRISKCLNAVCRDGKS